MGLQNSISEKTRKYLISIKSNDKNYLTVWGTDMENDEIDKLIINKAGDIVLSLDIDSLSKYLLFNSEFLFDSKNFEIWLNDTSDVKPYAYYNLDRIDSFINKESGILDEAKKDLYVDILDFLNLVQDYADQTNDKVLTDYLAKPSISMFVDYVYKVFFWSSEYADIRTIKKQINEEFNFKSFTEKLLLILNLFKNRFKVIPTASPSVNKLK